MAASGWSTLRRRWQTLTDGCNTGRLHRNSGCLRAHRMRRRRRTSLAMHCVGHQWPAEALQGHEHLQQFAALAVGNAHVAEQGGQQLQGGQQVAAEANAGHTGSAQVAQAVEQENREQWLHVEAQDAHMQVHPELKPSQVTPKLA